MWTCPACNREFKNEFQWHSCAKGDLKRHLKNKPKELIDTFDKLMDVVGNFGDFRVEPVKTMILLRTVSSFLSIKFKKDYLIIEFSLEKEYDELPVFRTFRISGKRILHSAILENVDDLDDELIICLREAYDLINN